ncbi:hypothetical protein M885DRAFT_54474 [Pelagophyceae sp. CCMP2097]|nr:hypothetical protein M885DRAFT_54474 [Pelagophyceae sp. CCMP2097]
MSSTPPSRPLCQEVAPRWARSENPAARTSCFKVLRSRDGQKGWSISVLHQRRGLGIGVFHHETSLHRAQTRILPGRLKKKTLLKRSKTTRRTTSRPTSRPSFSKALFLKGPDGPSPLKMVPSPLKRPRGRVPTVFAGLCGRCVCSSGAFGAFKRRARCRRSPKRRTAEGLFRQRPASETSPQKLWSV